MLCLLSLFPGVQMWTCLLSKNIAHFVHTARGARAPGGRDCRLLLLLFGGNGNELSTRNPSFPGFRPLWSHGGQHWEPLKEFYRSPFWMKIKCSALIMFFWFSFCFLLFLITSVYSYLKGVTASLTRRPVTPRQQTYSSCRWSFLETVTSSEVCPSLYPKKTRKNLLLSPGLWIKLHRKTPKRLQGYKRQYGSSCHQPSRVNTVKLQTPGKDVQSTIVLSLLICCMKSQKIYIFIFPF